MLLVYCSTWICWFWCGNVGFRTIPQSHGSSTKTKPFAGIFKALKGLDGPTERASGWLCLRRTASGTATWSGHAGHLEGGTSLVKNGWIEGRPAFKMIFRFNIGFLGVQKSVLIFAVSLKIWSHRGLVEEGRLTCPMSSSIHHVGCFKDHWKSSMPSIASLVFWEVFDAAHIVWKRWEMVESRHHSTLLWISRSRKSCRYQETFLHFSWRQVCSGWWM